MIASLRPFRGMQCDTQNEVKQTWLAISDLSTPAPNSWLQARVATLLSHFYVSNMDAKLMEAIAEDWRAVLKDEPAWAISNACRWWLSALNPNCHRKPAIGEIHKRCREETMPLRAAAMIAERGVRVEQTEKELVKFTGDRKEQVKKIMAEVFGRTEM